ncbi:hypothetical protein L228DRAFT_251186 [Xylona heveae TC161]|uniref:Zn(2)-C6 fungal-type domain-containing protein n=1 Tax=Xylona heveae (strain CBS 132557 / TC161) TaxID=1328760 RepID=A0A164ZH33_XYLHT|nr:hypothetical protein L228DRAFT_251186 [Xylona heveae TC161]KZF19096.1 hypothetical protein L228DRAFT_251186 [Xylona heveae TC161]
MANVAPSGRSRSLAGCITCRSRKVKCDETRPTCRLCARNNLVCGGYKARIAFVTYIPSRDDFEAVSNTDSDWLAGRRRVLYSEDERAAMSASVSRSVTKLGIQQVLEDLESDCLGLLDPTEIYKGPFGAFRLPREEAVKKQNGISLLCSTPRSIETLSESSLPASGTPEYIRAGPEATGCQQEQHDEHSLVDELDLFAAEFDPLSTPSHWDLATERAVADIAPLQISPLSYSALHEGSVALIRHLFEHYKSQAGRLFSPLLIRKSPWAVLHLPCALATFSELTLWNTASPVRLALFNALLAVSAFNLDRIQLYQMSATNRWWVLAEGFRKVAQKELQSCLSLEPAKSKEIKYKEQLMALLTMVTISVTSGELRDARYYLLEAEKIICERGLPKTTKSRKVAMLHHIYVFLRVIEESTFVYPRGTWCSPPIGSTAADNLHLAQFPSLQTHSFSLGQDLSDLCGLDFETELMGEREASENLFAGIYGIPESLLSLLSKTTCLANEILANTDLQLPIPLDLIEKSKLLENEIVSRQWEAFEELSSCRDESQDLPANRTIMHHMNNAIHSALLVYFYRRVSNLNPMILQSHVDIIIASLCQCEQEMTNASIVNCGILWPGFIAATEALGEGRQREISRFLRASAQTSGMRHFEVAADLAEEVWKIRREQGSDVSWVEIVRNRRVPLVLT